MSPIGPSSGHWLGHHQCYQLYLTRCTTNHEADNEGNIYFPLDSTAECIDPIALHQVYGNTVLRYSFSRAVLFYCVRCAFASYQSCIFFKPKSTTITFLVSDYTQSHLPILSANLIYGTSFCSYNTFLDHASSATHYLGALVCMVHATKCTLTLCFWRLSLIAMIENCLPGSCLSWNYSILCDGSTYLTKEGGN